MAASRGEGIDLASAKLSARLGDRLGLKNDAIGCVTTPASMVRYSNASICILIARSRPLWPDSYPVLSHHLRLAHRPRPNLNSAALVRLRVSPEVHRPRKPMRTAHLVQIKDRSGLIVESIHDRIRRYFGAPNNQEKNYIPSTCPRACPRPSRNPDNVTAHQRLTTYKADKSEGRMTHCAIGRYLPTPT